MCRLPCFPRLFNYRPGNAPLVAHHEDLYMVLRWQRLSPSRFWGTGDPAKFDCTNVGQQHRANKLTNPCNGFDYLHKLYTGASSKPETNPHACSVPAAAAPLSSLSTKVLQKRARGLHSVAEMSGRIGYTVPRPALATWSCNSQSFYPVLPDPKPHRALSLSAWPHLHSFAVSYSNSPCHPSPSNRGK